MADAGERLIWAAASTLRPLIKRLLASGVPFGRLEARLREVFVDVAETELALPDRPQTDSRVSLLTGINRKEVRRIRSVELQTREPRSFSMNYATSLISRWLTDPQTVDRSGRPRALPYQAARGASFMKLARTVTADLAPRVLLDELVRSGAVETKGDLVVLTSDAYVPKREPAKTLQILGEDPPELIETILRNIFSEGSDLLLQRKVYYDNLGSDAAIQIRAEMRREGERFLRRMNRLFAKHDRDRNPMAAGGDRYYAGIGVYFFEAPPKRTPKAPSARRHAARKTKEHEE
jgi:Family of unknown function (DUF6502)